MIDVLLATYHSDPEMLAEQMESIRAQRGVEVNVIRREDERGEGACANFGHLLLEARADYVAFSDQDDVWLPDKLSKSMAKMRELESRWGRDVPLCVFSDARLVDRTLGAIAPSHLRFAKLNPWRIQARQLVQQNVASGNTMLFNRALVARVGRIPPEAVMHDHYLMMVAALYGHIGYLDEATLLYRQHGRNVLGAGRPKLAVPQIRARIWANMRQAAVFPEFGYLRDYPSQNWWMRRWLIVRHGLWKNGWVRNLFTLLIV